MESGIIATAASTKGSARRRRDRWRSGGIRVFQGLIVPAAAVFLTSLRAVAVDRIEVSEGVLRLKLDPLVGAYVKFSVANNLGEPFVASSMALGHSGADFSYRLNGQPEQLFVGYSSISVFSPQDSDRDGMDDIWEMENQLDPLDPSDASAASIRIAGLSNLDEYWRRFDGPFRRPQFYGRELSLFNFGSPSARFESSYKELSLFNFGSARFAIEVHSRELTVYQGETPPYPSLQEAYSTEVSVFNLGSPLVQFEAIGREVAVFNGQRTPLAIQQDMNSREVTVFNFGSPSANVEAISRESSVFNKSE
jgi:hypothetical protein